MQAREDIGRGTRENIRLREEKAYALTISGIFWQEYQSCDCIKESEQSEQGEEGRGREREREREREKLKRKQND